MTIAKTGDEIAEAFRRDPGSYEAYRRGAVRVGPRVAKQAATADGRAQVVTEIARVEKRMQAIEERLVKAAGSVAELERLDDFRAWYSDSCSIKADLARGDLECIAGVRHWYTCAHSATQGGHGA